MQRLGISVYVKPLRRRRIQWRVTKAGILALCLASLAIALPARSHAAAWETIATRDGIVVSRRMIENRRLPQLRAQGEVRGTPQEILAVLLDVPAYRKWVPDCAEARTLERTSASRSLIYTRTNLPWPVADREAIIDQEVIFVREPTLLKIVFQAVAAPEVPRARGTIRTNFAVGSYTIEAIDGKRSKVTYEVDADPGGALPDWLVRRESTRNPLETIAGLRRQLDRTRGR